jgi:hypothetical protein
VNTRRAAISTQRLFINEVVSSICHHPEINEAGIAKRISVGFLVNAFAAIEKRNTSPLFLYVLQQKVVV